MLFCCLFIKNKQSSRQRLPPTDLCSTFNLTLLILRLHTSIKVCNDLTQTCFTFFTSNFQGKRKRKIVDFLNGSSISVSSPLSESSVFSSSLLEMSASGPMIADVAPEVKRKRSLSRMTSAISTPMAKMSSVLQRSLSSARLHGCPSPQKGTPTR